jgi:hypothetical protein
MLKPKKHRANLFLSEQCVRGLRLTGKIAVVVLDRLENLARAAGGVWADSKIWHGLVWHL